MARKKKEEGTDTLTRSFRVNLITPKDQPGLRSKIVASVRTYRAALRHNAAILLTAHEAGADVKWIETDAMLETEDEAGNKTKVKTKVRDLRVQLKNDPSRVIAALATQQAEITKTTPKENRVRGEGDTYQVKLPIGAVYELRNELARQMPNMMAFALDSARRDIYAAWQAQDPEFPKATRGYLALQGLRFAGQFRKRGIGIPTATGRPVLEGRSITLKWDREIGAVKFNLAKLEGFRWAIWKKLVSKEEGWTLGTVYLSEVDKDIFATISYKRPAKEADVDPARQIKLTVDDKDPETLIRYHGPDGQDTTDFIKRASVIAFLNKSRARREALEGRKKADGAKTKRWGHRKAFEHNQAILTRATDQRENTVKDYNHAWARRIIDRAASWRCGTIVVSKLPKKSFNNGPPVGSIGDHPWNWSQFKLYLEYKAKSYKTPIVIVWEDDLPDPDPAAPAAAA